jgi:hypothetical protein
MADQAINALSTKTAPETSDQLLLVGTGEPQLIDYDKLADAILNKITSKNYALDAGQMTLLAALNKLNSETVLKRVSVLNDNINDILIAGNYCNIVPVWGNIGGLYPSWAWGIVLTANNIANFIGVDTVGKKLAVAQYSNGTWKKIM